MNKVYGKKSKPMRGNKAYMSGANAGKQCLENASYKSVMSKGGFKKTQRTHKY